MVDQELELLYSPSRWCKRFGPTEVIDKHVQIVTEESERVKSSIPNNIGLRYGPKDAEKYDLYGGDHLPPTAPVFIYIHGGYWQALSREISAYCVTPLTKAGFRVAILGYTLAPQATLEEIVEEIQKGIRVILSQASEDGSRGVWVGGHSAGAHLAAMLVCQRPDEGAPGSPTTPSPVPGMQLLKGLVLISGIYHLAPLVTTTVNQPLNLDKVRATKLSPLALLSEVRLPAWARRLKILLAVAEHDSPAFVQQTRDMATALQGRVSSVEAVEMPGLDHFDIVEGLSSSQHPLTKHIIKFINSS